MLVSIPNNPLHIVSSVPFFYKAFFTGMTRRFRNLKLLLGESRVYAKKIPPLIFPAPADLILKKHLFLFFFSKNISNRLNEWDSSPNTYQFQQIEIGAILVTI